MLAFFLAVVPIPDAGGAAATSGGVVLEQVDAGSDAAMAGLQAGDLLLTWHRESCPPGNPDPAEGELDSPFDLDWIGLEQAPRGAVTLHLRRGERPLQLVLPPGSWQLATQPVLRGSELDTFQQALQLASEHLGQAVTMLSQLAASAQERSDSVSAAWYLIRAAGLAVSAGQWDQAGTQFDRALQLTATDPELTRVRYLVLQRYGLALGAQRRHDAAADRFRQALQLARNLAGSWGESFAVSSSLHELAQTAWRQGDMPAAEGLLRQVVAMRELLAPGCIDLARPVTQLGLALSRRGAFDDAETMLQHGLSIRRRWLPGSLAVASSLRNLGSLAQRRNNLGGAEERYRQALEIRQRLAPDSSDVAASYADLGELAFHRGDLEAAQISFQRALDITERHSPESPQVAPLLHNLGAVALEHGDLAAAEQLYHRALVLGNRLYPRSSAVATTLNNLGSLAHERGDLVGAESYFRRARDLLQQLAPHGDTLPKTFNNLGTIAEERGDLALAEDRYRAALSLNRSRAADSLAVAWNLHNLGSVAARQGRLEEAGELYRAALTIRQRLAPSGPDVATTLERLGVLARQRGELREAAELLQRSLVIRQRLLPDSILESASLRELGLLAAERGDTNAAEDFFRQALERRRLLAPGSYLEAESLHDLAQVYRAVDRRREALDHCARALQVLEAQQGRIGGSQQSRAAFRARFLSQYHDYLQLLIEAHQPQEAFHVLERSRAQSMLAMLAERDLVFSLDLPAELERERRRLAASYDRIQAELAKLSARNDPQQVDAFLQRLRRIRRRREEIDEEVHRKNPRLQALHRPQVLDAPGVLRSLDTGTVLLAYAVTEGGVYLFVLSAVAEHSSHVVLLELETTREQLAAEVRFFRGYFSHGRSPGADLRSIRRRARRLYRILVQPADPWLAAAQRLVICPDGVLHTLPFAALVRPETTAGGDGKDSDSGRYLVEWKPLHTAASATVYAQLRQRRRSTRGAGSAVVAFGDPEYPADSGSIDPAVVPVGSVEQLVRLPATRGEVNGLAEVWGDEAEVYLDGDATEQRAKGIGMHARIIHFACHGILDAQSPLDSALVLSIPEDPDPGRDNGYLQAWEIFEQMRIDADLVVLSACDTALGSNLAGEGLIGLTGAFQYAGARSVVATLWSVPDVSTAFLMSRFHAGLNYGASIDEALRQAQLELIRGPVEVLSDDGTVRRINASHPFAWAGFTVVGDWWLPGT